MTAAAVGPPRATYRLQFNRDFTFRDARELVPYLAQLGVSHVYASPIMEARPGSTHGYDIVDHNRLNPEIGTEDDFRALTGALRRHGMGLVVDVVPNHMGVGGHDNVWWLDVLEWGEASPFAHYFDINWDAARPDLKGRVLLPVLGGPYGAVLEGGEIEPRFDPDEGSLGLWYYEHRFPISPPDYGVILSRGGEVLASLARQFAALNRVAPGIARDRAPELKRRLAEAARRPEVGAAIDAALAALGGRSGRRGAQRLHRLLDAQAYRIAHWRVAADEINYRRFFNINDLAGLRMELPALFAQTHSRLFAMIDAGDVQGLRIDHIDGLFDPGGYLDALRTHLPEPAYIVVEKITARYEALPAWPVDGSTGYDFANQVLGLFVDPDGERPLTRLYQRLIGRAEDFDAVLLACKERIMRVNLASEMNVLAQRFHRLSMADWRFRDFTLNGMHAALEAVIAAFPVYRTYVSPRGAGEDDRRYIGWAVAQAKKRRRTADTSIFDFLRQVLNGAVPGHPQPDAVLRAAMQFQQITGPVMAKAAEDTAFYRYVRLLALNEVGGDPRRFGLSPGGFHHVMRERAAAWPRAMLATATHDTKRGEDARLRLAMLSELPRAWGRQVARWLRFNRSRRTEIDAETVPDRNVEYLFYQTLLGAWPAGLDPADADGVRALAERVAAYMTKAVREGKEVSSWSNPDGDYEAALERFVFAVLDAGRPNTFLAEFHAFAAPLLRLSAISSLAQTVLKLTVPGVPDIYQGCELWDFNLVDPDNRRPVDWERRRALLAGGGNADAAGPVADGEQGREKLFVIHRLLQLRQEHPRLFAEGEYLPLRGEGGRGDEHLFAFARVGDRTQMVVAVPRLLYRLRHEVENGGAWGATELALPGEGPWREVFSGRGVAGARVRAAELFSRFPVAVLLRTA